MKAARLFLFFTTGYGWLIFNEVFYLIFNEEKCMKNALKLIPTLFLAVLLFCGVSFATTITYVATD